MKYVVKRIFDDGSKDADGVKINHAIGQEYKGDNVKSLLASGLIESVGSNEPAPQPISKAKVEKIVEEVEKKQIFKKKKKVK